MDPINQHIGDMLARIRATRPLIHHITNLVVMNDTANVTLHVGGLPVMAHDAEEVAEMVAHAGALVLNVGTLSPDWIESMLIAGRRAKRTPDAGGARPGGSRRNPVAHCDKS